jgi:hypothetical protein
MGSKWVYSETDTKGPSPQRFLGEANLSEGGEPDRVHAAQVPVTWTSGQRLFISWRWHPHGYALVGEETIGVITRRIAGLSALSPWPPLPPGP